MALRSVSDTWEEFPHLNPIADMRFGFVNSISVDPDDTVWSILVLCGGASCYGNSVLYHLQMKLEPDRRSQRIRYGYWGPLFDATGIAWIFWTGGIYRIQGDAPELVSPWLAGKVP
jgi:hypothetical protein